MKRALCLAAVACAVLGGCGERPAPQPPLAVEQTAVAEAHDSLRPVTARVRVTDLRGRPVPNVLPIATDRPNAFQKPVAQGELTGSDGTSTLYLPPDKRLYVRAWDPTLRMFPNNFYEVLPSAGTETAPMHIAMAEGATLRITLLDARHEPAAHENTALMLFHDVHGPWWPSEADTDGHGRVVFTPMPPGEYSMRIRAVSSGELEIGAVRLPPGSTTDLGPIVLQ